MKLIEEWRSSHKYWSVRLSVVGTAATGVFLSLPQSMQVQVLDAVGLDGPAALAMVIFVGTVISRVVKQDGVKGDE